MTAIPGRRSPGGVVGAYDVLEGWERIKQTVTLALQEFTKETKDSEDRSQLALA